MHGVYMCVCVCVQTSTTNVKIIGLPRIINDINAKQMRNIWDVYYMNIYAHVYFSISLYTHTSF